MSKGIIGYSDFITDRHEYNRHGNGMTTEFRAPNVHRAFFSRRGHCRFCQADIPVAFEDSRGRTIGVDIWSTIRIWECPNCGWWECLDEFSEEYDLIDKVKAIQIDTRYWSVAKKFELGDKDLPVQVLVNELHKEPELIYRIHPTKMEELAQHVFASFFNCKVEHVGRSGDGGVDLLIVDSDEPILVQVKRRSQSYATESASTIRELLGAMFIRNSSRGIVLSTAKTFAPSSMQVRDTLLGENRLRYFELVDFDRFCAMLRVIPTSDVKPWTSLVGEWKTFFRR